MLFMLTPKCSFIILNFIFIHLRLGIFSFMSLNHYFLASNYSSVSLDLRSFQNYFFMCLTFLHHPPPWCLLSPLLSLLELELLSLPLLLEFLFHMDFFQCLFFYIHSSLVKLFFMFFHYLGENLPLYFYMKCLLRPLLPF